MEEKRSVERDEIKNKTTLPLKKWVQDYSQVCMYGRQEEMV